MAWWQIILIIVGAVVVGLVIGYLVSVLISNVIPALFGRRETVTERPGKTVTPSSVRPPVISNTLSSLIAEIEYNRRLSSSEWTGELHQFQTRAWDSQGDELNSLPADLRNELNEAYSDMALANSITWLSIEMKRRSPSLDESYTKLRHSISERLTRTKPKLESAGLIARSATAQKA